MTTLLLALPPLLQGCSLITDAVNGHQYPAVDERQRPWGEPLQDSALAALSLARLRGGSGALQHAQVSVASDGGTVLLVGQVPTEASRQSAARIVADIEGVHAVHNRLTVAPNRSLDDRAADAWITARIRAGMERAEPALWQQIAVVTDAGVVYLMGRVNPAAAAWAEQLARDTGGVQRVVTLFEYEQDD